MQRHIPGHLACPECRGRLHRAQRSLVDRLIGFIVASRRYRCLCRSCGWSGLLQRRPPQPGTYRDHFVLDAARMAPPAGPARRGNPR